MSRSFSAQYHAWLERQLYRPDDDSETIALKKRFWHLTVPAGIWVLIPGWVAWFFGLWELAIFIWIYAAGCLVLVTAFLMFPQKVRLLATLTQYFAVFTSVLLVLYFGGVLQSGGMVFIGLSGVLNAFAFFNPRQFRLIFCVYATTVVVEALLQPWLRPHPEMTPTVNLVLLVCFFLLGAGNLHSNLSHFFNPIRTATQTDANNLRKLPVQLFKLLELREKLRADYRQLTLHFSPPEKPPLPDETFLAKLKDLLNARMEDESFDTNELSRCLHISRIQLFRKLKALTGQTPSQFIHTYRLNRAKELLLSSRLSICEVAYEVGFKDPAYFTRAFTKVFGLTPSAMKRLREVQPV